MREHDKPSPSLGAPDQELPYAIELWDESRSVVEKVLARAFTLSLAREIFRVALQENPGRRIALRQGERLIEDYHDGSST